MVFLERDPISGLEEEWFDWRKRVIDVLNSVLRVNSGAISLLDVAVLAKKFKNDNSVQKFTLLECLVHWLLGSCGTLSRRLPSHLKAAGVDIRLGVQVLLSLYLRMSYMAFYCFMFNHFRIFFAVEHHKRIRMLLWWQRPSPLKLLDQHGLLDRRHPYLPRLPH
jgi:hypothetical protein